MRRRDKRERPSGRDPGGFIALPWSVIDSPNYQKLSMHARALLLEIARQWKGDNNGCLLCSKNYLAPRGWKSSDMITKAKKQLLDGGFIHEMVRGHRPNKASWYAVTWQRLDKPDGFDPGAADTFKRGAYMTLAVPQPKPTREELLARWRKAPAETQPLDRPAVQEVPA
jgi:hypothetical protein